MTGDLRGPEDEPIPFTRRYVVDSAAVGKAWRGSVVARAKRPFLSALVAGTLLVDFVVYYLSFDSRFSTTTRVVWALVWGAVTVVVIWVPLFALGYWMTKRNSRFRWYDGAVLESGFGAEAFVTRNPTMSRRIRYDAIRWIEVRGAFVHLRVLGDTRSLMYPRALFPDEEIARIRAHMPGRSPRPRGS